MTDAPAISIHGLVTRFGAQTVHDGLDLDVRRGEVMGVVGGSGTGKSVLLRTVVGLNRPAAGRIEVLEASRLLRAEGSRADRERIDSPASDRGGRTFG